jgi:hypothetical protein
MFLRYIRYVHKHTNKKVTTIIQTILNNQDITKHNQGNKKHNTVVSQNYFRCNEDYYKQEKGLEMGAQSSQS